MKLAPRTGDQRYEISMRVSIAIACLISVSCAHETSERPPVDVQRSAARPVQSSTPSSLPFPETAFSGNESDAHLAPSESRASESRDRFATRSIGPRGGEGGHRYNGARIDLDVKGADVHEVFRLIADVGKVNIVVAGEVSGTVTLKLKRVPWDQALDVVAKARGLSVERDGNVIMVHAH